MSRRLGLLLLVIFGPMLATVVFGVGYFGIGMLMGQQYSCEQIEAGGGVFFVGWQVVALVWLWRNWRQ